MNILLIADASDGAEYPIAVSFPDSMTLAVAEVHVSEAIAVVHADNSDDYQSSDVEAQFVLRGLTPLDFTWSRFTW